MQLSRTEANVVYWDHDHLRDGRRGHPVLKPDWDPLLHCSVDLLRGAAIVRCEAAAVGADKDCVPGELPAIMAAQSGTAPLHIPLILSHHAGDAAPPRHLPASMDCSGGKPPGVSVIIPTRDRTDLLAMCLAGLDHLDYAGQVELLLIDNDSREAASHAFFDDLTSSGRARVIRHPGPFNFAAMINRGAELAAHDMLCLLNNDIEPLDGAWLGRMVAHARLPQCGAIGAQLQYPDGTLQHAGIAIGIGGAAGHIAKGTVPDTPAHWLWHSATRRVSAVTAACLLVDRRRFQAVGGMDVDRFAVDFNDVDLCLKLQAAGYENRVVAEARLIHHESKSRGTKRIGADLIRFQRELANLRSAWGTDHYRDPWCHPLFRKDSQECLLQF